MAAKSHNGSLPTARGNPSKKIFVAVLTKDLDLADAIIELVDNSIDGARREGASTSFKKYEITLTFNENQFQIRDNCGGLSAKLAKDVALCFGRPDDAKPEKGLVGVFGVGLKRAIFKIGKAFSIKSVTSRSRFTVEDSYDDWLNRKDSWDFEFTEYEENAEQQDEVGTTITVTDVHEPISAELSTRLFESDLISRIADAQRELLQRDLKIVVNAIPVTVNPIVLKLSKHITPAFRSLHIPVPRTNEHIDTRIYAGITDSEPKAAGWYVFCNGRLILRADQTTKTGWGETGNVNIPRIHNQFARFRGYVFLSSENQENLPWTTSKNGLDVESVAYKKVRPYLVEMTRPVITFLNELDAEKDLDDKPLHDAIEQSPNVPLPTLKPNETFDYRRTADRPEEKLITISFKRPSRVVQKVKNRLAVGSNKEVGEEVFAYYCRYEKIKNE